MGSKPVMSSNASIFADRGDPWVSPREGREKFGRNVFSENPAMDCQLFAGKPAKADGETIVNRVPDSGSAKPDLHRRAVGAVLAGKRRVAAPVRETVAHDRGMAEIEGAKEG